MFHLACNGHCLRVGLEGGCYQNVAAFEVIHQNASTKRIYINCIGKIIGTVHLELCRLFRLANPYHTPAKGAKTAFLILLHKAVEKPEYRKL